MSLLPDICGEQETPYDGALGTPDREHFAKLCRLHTELSPTVLRSLFDQFHAPSELSRNLARVELRTKLVRLKSTGVLKNDDWIIIYPKTQPSSSQYFEFALVVTLLKTICHLSQPYPNGWDELPLDVDTSTSADVVRLAHYREQLIKTPRSGFSKDEYDVMRVATSNALLRLTAGQCGGRLEVIDSQPLDHDLVTRYVNLLRGSAPSRTTSRLRPATQPVTPAHRRPSHYINTSPLKSATERVTSSQTPAGANSARTKRSTSQNSGLYTRKVSSAIYETLMESLYDSKNHKDVSHVERQVLQKYLSAVTSDVSSDYLLQRLVQSGTLSHQERNRISLSLHHADRMRQALGLVGRKAGNAFAVFCGILRGRHKPLSEQIAGAKEALLNKDPPDPVCLANSELRLQYLALMYQLAAVSWYPDGAKDTSDFFIEPHLTDVHGTPQFLDDVIRQSASRDAPMRLLIEGASGCGKSTLCCHLAYRWAKGESSPIARYKLVVCVELRRMRSGADLSETVMQQCAPPTCQFGEAEMWAIIEANSADVLFILDGFKGARASLAYALLSDTKFSRSSFIVTVVDRFATDSLRELFDANYFLLGLHCESLCDLLDSYTQASDTPAEQYRSLCTLVESAEPLAELLRTPLYFQCACLVCDANSDVHARTATALLTAFVDALCKRYAFEEDCGVPNGGWSESYELALRRLEEFAFRQTLSDASAFGADELIEFCAGVTFSGLVVFYDAARASSADEPDQMASFVCEAIQEFLAARHIARSAAVLHRNFDLIVGDVRFRTICVHLFGLLSKSDDVIALRMCTSIAEAASDESRRAIEQGTFDNFRLPLECMNECALVDDVTEGSDGGDDDACNGEVVTHNGNELNDGDDYTPANGMSLDKDIVLHETAIEKDHSDTGEDGDRAHLTNGTTAIDACADCRRDHVILATLSVARFGAMLPPAVRLPDTGSPLAGRAVRGLAHLLRADCTTVERVELELGRFGDHESGAVAALAAAVAASTCVSRLVLRWTSTDLLARFLSLCFVGNTTLSHVTLHDTDAADGRHYASAEVRNALRVACASMQHVRDLRLRDCRNAALVSALLRHLPGTALRRLSLAGCRLDVVASRELARHVERTRTLDTLDLTRVRIKRPTFRIVADCLSRNRCLRTLILSGVTLDAADVTSLAEALRLNYTLARIDLSRTTITDGDCETLNVALRDNDAVSHVSVVGCPVSDNGAEMMRRLGNREITIIR